MEIYVVGLLKFVDVAADRRKIGVDEGSGPGFPGGSFEVASDGNREGGGPVEVDPLVIP